MSENLPSENLLSEKPPDTEISMTKTMNFLGIVIDYKLTFKNHIDQLGLKISRSVGVIYHISSFMPASILPNLYFSLILSRLSYGTSLGGSC